MNRTPAPAGRSRLYDRIERIVSAIDDAMMFVGCAMLFALMSIVVADVSLRYLFNSPLTWSFEIISSYLMPGLFFMAASHTLKAHSHVAVDILHNYVGRRTRYAFEALSCVLAAPIFAMAAWVSAQTTWSDFQAGAVSSSGLELPTWTISLMLPLGFGMLALRLALHAVGYLATLATGREIKALPPISGTEEFVS
ncbi:MAG TPA: TRAP transporter small permease [Burkholderiaceae bacterium]